VHCITEEALQKKMKAKIKSEFLRILLAEFAGTFVLITFGDGSVAQSILSKSTKGDFFSINWGYAVAVMLGVYVSLGVSGGHLNPAVTIAMAISGKLKNWKRNIPAYLIGQYLGSFCGAAVVFGIYHNQLMVYSGGALTVDGDKGTAGIFATYPSPDINQLTGFFDQILGTGLLLFCVRGLTDDKNGRVPAFLQPFLIGLVVLNIGIAFGLNAGYAINPARDLSPRLFTLIAGYGPETFSAFDFWFYVPIVATHLGAVIGCTLYDLLIGWHMPTGEDSFKPEQQQV